MNNTAFEYSKKRAEHDGNQVKVNKLPTICFTDDRQLHDKHKDQHVNHTVPSIDGIIVNVNVTGMKPRRNPIKEDPVKC